MAEQVQEVGVRINAVSDVEKTPVCIQSAEKKNGNHAKGLTSALEPEGGGMMNINGHNIAVENFDPAVHVLEPGYFDARRHHFEEQYKSTFPAGSGQFFDAYSNGDTDLGNLDFEEWAFICEHFLVSITESWCPPSECAKLQEKPESNSGFSFGRGNPWFIRCCDISTLWTKQSQTAVGLIYPTQI
jgi:hypothetical protein